MNVGCQPHRQPEDHDAPASKHRQRRPQHHEQESSVRSVNWKRGRGFASADCDSGVVMGLFLDDAAKRRWWSSASIAQAEAVGN